MLDLIIIGAGASGLFAANHLGENTKYIILEKMENAGKKILVSGSGQCNLTNAENISSFPERYNNKGRYIRSALSKYSSEDLMKFFTDRGLMLITRDDGKVFPQSMKSADVLGVLTRGIKENILYRQKIVSATYADGVFRVETKDEVYTSKALLIATGGMTYPHLGTTGDGYEYASGLGHRIKEPVSALKGIISREDVSALSGIAIKDAEIKAGKKTYAGDLLFTHTGISGPVIINNSRDFQTGDRINIALGEIAYEGKKTVVGGLSEFMPRRLAEYILSELCIDEHIKLASMTKDMRRRLTEMLLGFPVTIESFTAGMVTSGGVSFGDVNKDTFMSRKIPGLFFAGEVLDIDGETGGYNFQAAFSSAFVASKNIENFLISY